MAGQERPRPTKQVAKHITITHHTIATTSSFPFFPFFFVISPKDYLSNGLSPTMEQAP